MLTEFTYPSGDIWVTKLFGSTSIMGKLVSYLFESTYHCDNCCVYILLGPPSHVRTVGILTEFTYPRGDSWVSTCLDLPQHGDNC